MPALNADVMRAIAPRFRGANGARQDEIITRVGAVLETVLADYDINTPLRAAHFLAQICHESAGFRATEEFADGSAYEGRANLGNTRPGDGRLFKGRGLIQLTGRANYETYGELIGIDMIENPHAGAEPVMSLKIACEFWRRRGLNAYADADDITTITRRINGGLNGIDERKALLAKAKAVLGGGAHKATAPRATVRQGDKGAHVVALQQRLVAAGYPITADGAFGPATALAVKQLQDKVGLTADGIVGPRTWAALA